MESFRFKVASVVLLLLLFFLQYRLWCQPGGIRDMMQLKKQLVAEQVQNDFLRKRNQALLLQVQHLQKNPDATESRARQELGMIKKDEIFYQVVK